MLPGSGKERISRRSISGGRTKEIQRLIGRSLRAAVDLAAMPEVTARIDCDVLQADGGTRTASITGAWVALADALDVVVASGKLPASPIIDHVAAVSVGILDDQVLLDLGKQMVVVRQPLELTQLTDKFNVNVTVKGGGTTGQAAIERLVIKL